MKFYSLAFLLFFLQFFLAFNAGIERPASSPIMDSHQLLDTNMPVAANIIFQSKDGGQTWQDISNGLPENQQPEDLFASESTVYLRVKNGMYRSKSNLITPVWEKEKMLDPQSSSIAFNRSGTLAYNYEGKIYQKSPTAGTWMPVYTNFKKHTMQSIVETTDGALFVGSENGLYKSADQGQSWNLVLNEGWVRDIVESEGVLIGTGQKGIMRSTDKGEHWEWVINEGGVGIAVEVERIDGGFAAIAYSERTKTRNVYLSMDSGKTWQAIDRQLQPALSISSIKQFGNALICGHPDGIFRSSDMGKTWKIVHPSVTKNEFKVVKTFNTPFRDNGSENEKVFTLYVSGHVVYAVARDSGC